MSYRIFDLPVWDGRSETAHKTLRDVLKRWENDNYPPPSSGRPLVFYVRYQSLLWYIVSTVAGEGGALRYVESDLLIKTPIELAERFIAAARKIVDAETAN